MYMYKNGVKNIVTGISIFLLLSGVLGCGNKPLFDEMSESRLRVVIKGTFESNDPRGWQLGSATSDESIHDVSPIIKATSKLMLDFAEIRLDSFSGGNEDRFANYRETFSIPLLDTEPFFNGMGVTYECDDVKPDKTYGRVNLYIRKMIFDQAIKYYLSDSGTWSGGSLAEVIFREKDMYGLDFNQLMVNTYYDSLKENADDINRVFPLRIPIDGGLLYEKNDGEVVLEIRLVFKNFIEQFEYDYYDEEGRHSLYHFWGLSDWLRDVFEDERPLGGNLHAIARAYKPDESATITGNTNGEGYVIAIPADSDISEYLISNGAGDRDRPLYDSGTTERYSRPSSPYLPAENSIESYLDYYLKYEQYKIEYNLFVAGVNDTGTADGQDYESVWDSYNNYVDNFKIPPIVTYVGSATTYTLDNVPTGQAYKIYRASGIGFGQLPYVEDCTGPVTTSVITGNYTEGSNI